MPIVIGLAVLGFIAVLLFGSRKVLMRLCIITAVVLAVPSGILGLWLYQNTPATVVVAASVRPDYVQIDPNEEPALREVQEKLNTALFEQAMKDHPNTPIKELMPPSSPIDWDDYSQRLWAATDGKPWGVPVGPPPKHH